MKRLMIIIKKYWYHPLYLLLIIVLILLLFKSCNKSKDLTNLYNFIQDSLHTYKLKDSSSVSYIAALEVDKQTLMSLNAGNDSRIKELQNALKQNSKAIDYLITKVETIDHGNTITNITYEKDSLDTCLRHFPIYNTQWNEKWSIGSITAKRDSIYRDIRIKNEFDSWHEYKKGQLTVFMKNLNPNTSTTELTSYVVPKKTYNKHFVFGVGPNFSFGYGLINKNFDIYIGVGVTLSYKIFAF